MPTTFTPITPGANQLPQNPQFSHFNPLNIVGPIGVIYRPINPLPATSIIGGSFAMSLAPLVLPFLALLSWWFK